MNQHDEDEDPIIADSPEEVAKYLRSKQPPSAQDVEASTAAAVRILQQEAAAKEAKGPESEPYPTPEDLMGVANPKLDTLVTQMDRLLRDTGLPSVELTEDEKDEFCNAVMEDRAFRCKLTFPLRKGLMLSTEWRSLKLYEREAAYQASYELTPNTPNVGINQLELITNLQRVHVLLQLQAVNGRSPWSSELKIEVTQDVRTAGKTLAEFARTCLRDMSEVRWSTLLTAWKMFEAKFILAQGHANDPNFWQPAAEG